MRKDKFTIALYVILLVVSIIDIIGIILFAIVYNQIINFSIIYTSWLLVLPIIIMLINIIGLAYIPVFIKYRKNK